MTSSVFLNFIIWLLFIAAFIEVLTLIHELGHFLVAKYNKVRVAEFAIGFGPVMFQWGKKETKYSIRWFPFGGYVSVLNEDVQNSILKMRESNLDPIQWEMAAKQVRPFNPKDDTVLTSKPIDKVSWFGKFSFALMGVTFNFVFMFSAIWIFAGSMGTPTLDNNTYYIPQQISNEGILTIGEVTQFRVSDDLDFTDTDTDYTINGYTEVYEFLTNPDYVEGDNIYVRVTTDFIDPSTGTAFESGYATFTYIEDDCTNLIDDTNGATGTTVVDGCEVSLNDGTSETTYNVEPGWVHLTYSTNTFLPSQTLTTSNMSYFRTQSETYVSGFLKEDVQITPFYGKTFDANQVIISRYTLEHVNSSFVESWEDTALILTNALLFTFTFGIVQIDDELPNNGAYFDVSTAEKWVMFCFNIFIILSAIMIIFNLLPIPPLDGWKATQWTYEEITGKRMDPIKEQKINKIGWTVVIVYSMLFLFVPLFPGY